MIICTLQIGKLANSLNTNEDCDLKVYLCETANILFSGLKIPWKRKEGHLEDLLNANENKCTPLLMFLYTASNLTGCVEIDLIQLGWCCIK